jgi:hypothetical protein
MEKFTSEILCLFCLFINIILRMSKSRIRSDPEFIGRAPPKSSVRSGHIGARVPTQYFIVLNSTKTPALSVKRKLRTEKFERGPFDQRGRKGDEIATRAGSMRMGGGADR